MPPWRGASPGGRRGAWRVRGVLRRREGEWWDEVGSCCVGDGSLVERKKCLRRTRPRAIQLHQGRSNRRRLVEVVPGGKRDESPFACPVRHRLPVSGWRRTL